jgi:hypothetical protein
MIDQPLKRPREASCRQKGNDTNDAMNAYHNAAKAYKKVQPECKFVSVDLDDLSLIVHRCCIGLTSVHPDSGERGPLQASC